MNISFWIKVLVVLCCFLTSSHVWTKSPLIQGEENALRVLHFVLRDVELERAHWLVSEARKAGFNTIQVLVTDGVHLDQAPWKPRAGAWTKKEFFDWVQNVRSQGIEVVPELKLLTHQEKLFQVKYPDLMFNSTTYNPLNDKTYQRVFAILDEIIDVVNPRFISIGHDELAGNSVASKRKWLHHDEEMLPVALFLLDVLKVYNYLKKKNIETWMWGDMLIAPHEFPTMHSRHLHGSADGYGKTLRDQLPRDIVICDWHYFDDQTEFPSLSTMKNEGFRVIGSTWKKEKTIRNFSQYAAQHNAYGMMATTWFHVQRKEWDVIKRIIEVSGEAFSRDFPDAR